MSYPRSILTLVTCIPRGFYDELITRVELLERLTAYYFRFLAVLFSARTSFLRRASTILYRPFTPLGRPWMPRLPPRATTTLVCFLGVFFAALLIILVMFCALSFSVRSVSSARRADFFRSFSSRCAALNFFRSLASRTFLMGRAFKARSFSLMAAAAAAVMGRCGLLCLSSSSRNHSGKAVSISEGVFVECVVQDLCFGGLPRGNLLGQSHSFCRDNLDV